MNIKFLGSASSIPDPGNDCPCFLLNRRYLVDCGYSVVTSVWDTDCDVSCIDHIIFTHMHHDHYIGLAGLLFYMLQSKKQDISKLTVIGPSDVDEILQRTYSFLQLDKSFSGCGRPKVIALAPGETYENEEITLTAGSCYHPVDARCYRFTDKADGKALAITGDTAFKPEMATLFNGASAIIHDCTLGTCRPNDDPASHTYGHSSIYEAIELCRLADIPILFPVHMNTDVAKAAIKAARPTTSTKIVYPEKGTEFVLY